MQLKVVHNGQVLTFSDPDLVLVTDDAGNPCAVAAARYGSEGTFLVSSIDDDVHFKEVLRRLGLDRTLIVQDLGKRLSRNLTRVF